MEVKLSNVDLSVINALRRTIIADLEIYAIGNVKIEETNTPLIHESVTHRLEMIPVIQNNNQVKEGQKLTVNVKTDKESINVLSDDIRIGKDCPFVKDLLIIELRIGIDVKEYIKMSGEIVKGTAKDNAKFQCVTVAGIKNDNTLTFRSRGQLTEKEILKRGINRLLKRLNDFKSSIEDNNSNKVRIEKTGDLQMIMIDNEDDTLGNMIQKVLLPYYDFVSYNKTHPAEYNIIVKVKTDDPIQALYKACDLIEKEIKKIIK